jgi:hypothetical protein
MGKRLLISLAFVAIIVDITASAGYSQPAGRRQQRPGFENARQQNRPQQGNRRHANDPVPASLEQTEITVTLGETDGAIKPLLGVNAGPVPSGDKNNADVTAGYQTCGVTMVRTHDFYGPFDLSTIYPDITANPAVPESYNFKTTDEVFKAIINGGFTPFIRIGDSYSNARSPASEQERSNLVAAACEQIRHFRSLPDSREKYSHYVEIGNEPETKQFWPAGFEDYLLFYKETYTALKRNFPGIKIGGPGFVIASYKIPQARSNVHRFLAFLKNNNITPDFVSFHIYSNNPAEYYDAVNFYRNACQQTGITNTALYVTEWNTGKDNTEFRLGQKAAPYLTANWIALQEANADAAFFYRGTDTSSKFALFFGMFHADGRPKPAAKAFELWSEFSKCSRKKSVQTGISLLDNAPQLSGNLKPLWLLAGEESPKKLMFLISNIGEQTLTCTLQLPNQPKIVAITEIHGQQSEVNTYTQNSAVLTIKPLSVQLVRLNTD